MGGARLAPLHRLMRSRFLVALGFFFALSLSVSPAHAVSVEAERLLPTHLEYAKRAHAAGGTHTHTPTPPYTRTPTHPHTASFPPDALPALCPAVYQLQHPTHCPDVGPGRYAGQIAAAGLPYPLPAVRVTPEPPYRGLVSHAYARVITETAPVYRHPLEMLAGLPPFRRFENGFDFVSVMGEVTLEGATFYQINPGEFMRAEDVEPVRPSFFQGMFLAEPPVGPVGWIIGAVQPSRAPGQPPDPAAPFLWRYHQFQVHGVQRAGDWNWYLIGPGQWVEQRSVALVQPFPPAGAAGNVIAVDTYEQSLGVYQGGRLMFATLVSSGSRYFPTRPGVFNTVATPSANITVCRR